MNRIGLIIIASLQMSLVGASICVSEAKTPVYNGRGSRQAWQRAIALYDQAYDTTDPDKAITLYRRAIALYPYCSSFYQNLSVELTRQGKAGEAEAMSRKAIAFDPSDFEYQWQYAKTLVDQDKLLAARAVLTQLRVRQTDAAKLSKIDGILKQIRAASKPAT